MPGAALPHIPCASLRRRFALVEAYTGGEGWSGRVRDRVSGRELLLKVLPGGIPAQEASLLASLEHPRIPAVLETGQTGEGDAYMLREHLAGTPLHRLLPLAPSDGVGLATQLLEVLAYVHLRGILHLDIKPANVLQTSEADYVLLDFGLGARGGEQAAGGTPFYASPEQLLGLPTDARSDLFSLGALLFAALGHRCTPRRAQQDFFSVAGVDPAGLPGPFDTLLPRLLATDPGRRFPDAQEALEFLTGGSGRPSAALLRPDPIQMFGARLQERVAGMTPGADLHIHGGVPEDRRLLSIHAGVVLGGVTRIDAREDRCVLRRGGEKEVIFEIPPLSADDIARHLHRAAGLDPDSSLRAADALLARGVISTYELGDFLEELVAERRIVANGPRWIWPDAMTRRLDSSERPPVEPTADGLRRAAASGHVLGALRAYRRCSNMSPAEDRRLRAGLAEGLLRVGEPARCLTLVPDLPAYRARALYDMGQPELAEELLDGSFAGPEVEQLRAAIDYSRGRFDQAETRLRRLLERTPASEQRALLGLVLLAKGENLAAREELTSLLDSLDKERLPFAHAAALNNLAEVERRFGAKQRAVECYRAAMDILQSLGNVRHTATTSSNLGVLAKDAGDLDEATEHLRRARSLFEHLGDRAGAAVAKANLGVVSLESGDAHGARRRLQQARKELARLGAEEPMPLVLLLLARAHAMLGDWKAVDACVAAAGPPRNPRLEQELQRVQELRERRTLAGNPMPRDESGAMEKIRPESEQPPKEVFRTFLAINRRLGGEADLERAMTYLLDAAVTLSGGRNGILLVSRPDGVRREFSTGGAQNGPAAFSRSMINRALQAQRILTEKDAQSDRELMDMPSVRNLQQRSAACAPFRCASGTVGAIYVEHPGRSGVFGEVERGHLEILADQAAIAVDRMLREEQLAAELQQSRRDLQMARRVLGAPARMIGESAPMAELRGELERLAVTDLSVLILGETGTGKDLVARMIHDRSPRARGPFVAENCSAIAADLMESELFGHTKGAFTGADADREGLFELASGGTLFLDEIGDMPLELQARLLRALQERRIRRVGDSRTIPVDIRLVAATHKDIRAAVKAGTFREDLYFRVAAVELKVPALRDRGRDILLLARDFLARFNKEQGRTVELGRGVEDRLLGYPWPGNVRELQHVVARAAILADGDRIEALDLPEAGPGEREAEAAGTPTDAGWPVITLQEAEARTIRAALAATGGEKAKAARLLGISRTALYEKLKRIQRQES